MKMSHEDFDIPKNISVSELEKLRAAIDSEITAKREAEMVQIAKAMREMANAHGFQIEKIIPFLTERDDRPVRYRHPDHPELTWCGRGRRPLWMTEAIASGITLAALTA